MTRRKASVLSLVALVVVYAVGGVIGVSATRARLLGDIDEQLATNVTLFADLAAAFPLEAEEFAAERETDRAVVLVSPSGDIDFERTVQSAGQAGRPDLSVAEIVARSGEVFTVSGIDVDQSFRVIVEELDDGSFLMLARPLDELGEVMRTLKQVLFATLFGVVAMLGLMFWWLARVTLEPYDEIVQTADAIVEGDLDRRVSSHQPDPDVQRLVGSINRMLDQNQDALTARTEAEDRVTRFAAEASHELRTPLATIAGYSEVYLSGASTDPDSVKKQMTRINGEAARLGRLVESMLTITRLDNQVSLETDSVDVVEVARAAVADAALGASTPESATQFSLHGADGGPLLVEGDSDSLYRALANLLVNAQVHAPGAEAVVSVEVEGVDAVITVSDDGRGMPPHVAANAFDRFFRGSPTSDSGLRTTGLGLSITAGIVKAHGGTIELDTSPGEGATFTIRLPLADTS